MRDLRENLGNLKTVIKLKNNDTDLLPKEKTLGLQNLKINQCHRYQNELNPKRKMLRILFGITKLEKLIHLTNIQCETILRESKLEN